MKVSQNEAGNQTTTSELNSSHEIGRLETELESAQKLIEELKWVQVHCDNKMHVQELKMDELQVIMLENPSFHIENLHMKRCTN
jgi:hypothetical protein